jgi:hypothetical protein
MRWLRLGAGAQPAFSSQIKAANRSVIGTVSASRHRKASHFLDWDTEAVQDFSIQTRRGAGGGSGLIHRGRP